MDNNIGHRISGESKIPVLHQANHFKSRLSKPLAALSGRVRAHIDYSSSNSTTVSKKNRFFTSSSSPSNKSTVAGKFDEDQQQQLDDNNNCNNLGRKLCRPTTIFPSEYYSIASDRQLGAACSPADLRLTVGCRVKLVNGKEGVVRYHGETNFGKGLWCGIELDCGQDSSEDDAVKYFKCADFKGIFVRSEDVLTVTTTTADEYHRIKEYIDSEISDSGPHSLLGITSTASEYYACNSGEGKDEFVTEKFKRSSSTGNYFSHFPLTNVNSQLSTPTPSSNSEFIAPWDRKVNSSQHSSSAGSLVHSWGGGKTFSALDGLSSSLRHTSKHSSFEFEDSLGILTPDQMAEFTANCSEDSKASYEDFGSLNLQGTTVIADNNNSSLLPPERDFTLVMTTTNETIQQTVVIPDDHHQRSLLMADIDLALDCEQEFFEEDQDDRMFTMELPSEREFPVVDEQQLRREDDSKISQPAVLPLDEEANNRTYSLEELPIDDAASDYCCIPNLTEDELDGLDGLDELPSPFVEHSDDQQIQEHHPGAGTIVTSVTSIGSWDNGYQGDGEFSRPTSRGPVDVSPSAHMPTTAAAVKLRVVDAAATDSDFFTESDPDVHEDISSCMSGGDRKARVIDGTLYGSLKKSTTATAVQSSSATPIVVRPSNDANDCVNDYGGNTNAATANTTITNSSSGGGPTSEEMDSSGIYSDLDRKDDHRNDVNSIDQEAISSTANVTLLFSQQQQQQQQQEETFSDTSGNSSNKSISSQIKVNRYRHADQQQQQPQKTTVNLENDAKIDSRQDVVTGSSSSSCRLAVVVAAAENNNDYCCKHRAGASGVGKVNNNNNNNNNNGRRNNFVIPSEGTFSKELSSSADEKYPSSQQQQQQSSNKNHNKQTTKKNKWDAIMFKIEKSRAEEKYRPARLREIKSKVVSSSSSSSCSNATLSRDSSLVANRIHHRNCDARTLSPIAINVINADHRVSNSHRSSGNGNNANNLNNRKYYSKNLTTATLSNSTRSLKEGSSFNGKNRSRKCRARGSESPKASIIATAPPSLSQASSRNSSISDISDSIHQDLSHRSLPTTSSASSGPIRGVIEGATGKKSKINSCSPIINRSPIRETINTVSTRSSLARSVSTNSNNINHVSSTTNSSPSSTLSRSKTSNRPKSCENTVPTETTVTNGMKVPIGKKVSSVRRCAAAAVTKVTPLKDQNRVIGNGNIREHATSVVKTVGEIQNIPVFQEDAVVINNARQNKIIRTIRQQIDDLQPGTVVNGDGGKLPLDNNLGNGALTAQLKQANRGIEAFAVIVQHLTRDPDVYCLPAIKNQLSHYRTEWNKTKQQLDEKTTNYRKLEEEFLTQKVSYEQKLENIRNLHTGQLCILNVKHKEDLDKCALDYQINLTELENDFRNQESNLRSEFQQELKAIEQKAENKLKKILDEAMRHVDHLKNENFTYQERIRLESKVKADQLEKQFIEKETKLLEELELLRVDYEIQLKQVNSELEKKQNRTNVFDVDDDEQLTEAASLDDGNKAFVTSNHILTTTSTIAAASSVNEIRVRRHREPPSPSWPQYHFHRADKEIKVQTTLIPPRHQFQNLEDEVCSLRDVLDLKCSEIQDLRKQNEKLKEQVEDLPYICQKLDSSIARIEDLKAQLQTKTNSEHGLLKENRKLSDSVQQETEKKKRLEFQNEELLWKLKRSSQVAKALATININKSSNSTCNCVKDNLSSKSDSPESNKTELSDKGIRRSKTDNDLKFIDSSSSTAAVSATADESSQQQKVLGVVEKSDSVSWVLEIEEPPIAVASRMLRRASSLRGMPSKKTCALSSSSSSSSAQNAANNNNNNNSDRHRHYYHERHNNNYTLPTRGKNRHRPRLLDSSKETIITDDVMINNNNNNDTNNDIIKADGNAKSVQDLTTTACSTASKITGAAAATTTNIKFRSFSQSDVELSSFKQKKRHLLDDDDDMITNAVIQGLVDGNDSPDISAIFDFLPDSDLDDSSFGTTTDRSDLAAGGRSSEELLPRRVGGGYNRQPSSFSDCTTNSDSSLELDDYNNNNNKQSVSSSDAGFVTNHGGGGNNYSATNLPTSAITASTQSNSVIPSDSEATPILLPKDSAGEALISQVPSENEVVYSSEDNMDDCDISRRTSAVAAGNIRYESNNIL